ncbi:unnamed protein product [Spirodela intermedia]|uniref:Uncharacterized protein n=1 Tax=Spirodela intermedia TaxID=51605 RepID=A0A7I8JC22_SPIIN|nr:unnamed protein product [Spirodela intermedia]CAA6667043.1 unnamed protein product [Spirodela intermedia]
MFVVIIKIISIGSTISFSHLLDNIYFFLFF